MGNDSSIRVAVFCLFLMGLIVKNHAISVDVKTKGAKADGKTDDGPVNGIHTIFIFICF